MHRYGELAHALHNQLYTLTMVHARSPLARLQSPSGGFRAPANNAYSELQYRATLSYMCCICSTEAVHMRSICSTEALYMCNIYSTEAASQHVQPKKMHHANLHLDSRQLSFTTNNTQVPPSAPKSLLPPSKAGVMIHLQKAALKIWQLTFWQKAILMCMMTH